MSVCTLSLILQAFDNETQIGPKDTFVIETSYSLTVYSTEGFLFCHSFDTEMHSSAQAMDMGSSRPSN